MGRYGPVLTLFLALFYKDSVLVLGTVLALVLALVTGRYGTGSGTGSGISIWVIMALVLALFLDLPLLNGPLRLKLINNSA